MIDNATNITETGSAGELLSLYNEDIVKRHLVPSVFFIVLMMIIGVPGNLLAIFVYVQRWRKTTSRIFIVALTAFDLVLCFFAMPVEIYFLLNFVQTDLPVLCKVSRFLTFFMNNASSVILLGIAVDRFSHLCLPFKKQMTPKGAKIVVLIAMICSLSIGWPSLLIYGTHTFKLPSHNVMGKTCLISDHMYETKYPLMYICVLMFGNIISDVLMVGLYSVIGHKVLHSTKLLATSPTDNHDAIVFPSAYKRTNKVVHKERKNNTPHSNRIWLGPLNNRAVLSPKPSPTDNQQAQKSRMMKSTLMLFLVTLLFIITFVPYCVIVLIRYLNPKLLTETSDTNITIHNLFIRTYFLSSALNPVIYSFMSQKFRTECKKIFWSWYTTLLYKCT